MEKEYRLSTEEVLSALETSEHGLSGHEAAKRLETYGKNGIDHTPLRPRMA